MIPAQDPLARIAADPRYVAMVRARNRLSIVLTATLTTAYFGFLALIAFDKPLLATPIGAGVTSVGIILGLAMIALAIVLTGIYVATANARFDAVVDALKAEGEA